MTEFKKVTLLVDELSSASDSLIRDDRQAREIDPSADADDLVRRRYRTGLHVSTALVDGLDGRIAKLLAKALETDPNKQVYNERMCEQIVSLHRRYVAEVNRLLLAVEGETGDCSQPQPLLPHPPVDEASAAQQQEQHPEGLPALVAGCRVVVAAMHDHDDLIVRTAATDAWKLALLNTCDALGVREGELRTMCRVDERHEWAAHLESFGQGRRAIREKERLLEEARWSAELERRRQEAACVKRLVDNNDDAARSIEALLDGSHDDLRKRIMRLFQELLVNPENEGVRTMRCCNEQFVAAFGHEALCSTSSTDGQEGPSCCSCRSHHDAAMHALYAVGYVPVYSRGQARSVLMLQSLQPPNLALPCGAPLKCHIYSQVGYEVYGERALLLTEPDPMERPDAWCDWRERVELFAGKLESGTSSAAKKHRTDSGVASV